MKIRMFRWLCTNYLNTSVQNLPKKANKTGKVVIIFRVHVWMHACFNISSFFTSSIIFHLIHHVYLIYHVYFHSLCISIYIYTRISTCSTVEILLMGQFFFWNYVVSRITLCPEICHVQNYIRCGLMYVPNQCIQFRCIPVRGEFKSGAAAAVGHWFLWGFIFVYSCS